MAQVFSDNVVEIAVVQSYAGRPAVNVFHMRATDEWFPASSEAIVRDFANNWQDHVLDIQTASVALQGFEWRSLDLSAGGGGTMAPDPAKPVNGALAVAEAPANVALLVHKNTANRPRGRRDGRMYLVGVTDVDTDAAGTLQAPYAAAIQTAMDNFYDGISDTGVFTNDGRYPVVLETTPASRAPGSAIVSISSRRVTSLTIDARVATMRERLR